MMYLKKVYSSFFHKKGRPHPPYFYGFGFIGLGFIIIILRIFEKGNFSDLIVTTILTGWVGWLTVYTYTTNKGA